MLPFYEVDLRLRTQGQSKIEWAMEHILQTYASSSEDGGAEEDTPGGSVLGELPIELRSIFADSEYDIATERREAEERGGGTQWVRRFPHERGNWPTYVFVPVPNSVPFTAMAEASVAKFRRSLAKGWKERHGSDGARGGKKRARNGRRSSKRGHTRLAGQDPPEVVMNDMGPSGQQHLSLSRTTALRAHQIEPFVQGLKETVKSSRRFAMSIVAGYDVLVNDDKTRSFVCLRVRGGRHLVLQLIAKVDPLMRRFKQPEYYENPMVHVSVASVLGDVSSYVGSSSSEAVDCSSLKKRAESSGKRRKAESGERHNVESSSEEAEEEEEEEEEEDSPDEVCVRVCAVACKAGTTLYEAPLLPDP